MKKTILLSILVFVLAFGLSLSIQQVLAAIIIGSDLDMQSNRIINLGTPTGDLHAATKKYVDDSITGTAQFWAVSGTHIYNANTGNVGIGTTRPGAKLDVFGATDDLLQLQRSGAAVPITFRGGTDSAFVVNVGGSDRFTIKRYGNVGIGQMDPKAKLDVEGQIKITGGSPGTGKVLTSDATGLAFWQTITGTVPSGVSGQTLRHDGTSWIANSAIVNNGTNVGIGTNIPTAKLDVGGQIKITGGSPGTGKVLTSDATGLASWQTITGTVPSGVSGQTLRHDGTSWIANSVIFNNGTNVGIGTTSPGTKLDVFGATDNLLRLQRSGAADSITFKGGTDSAFVVNVGGSDRFTITRGGNVGIGTNTPTAKLDVGGQIKITGGSPGTGKVLTSDATGLAFWQTITGTLPSGASGQTLIHDGTSWIASSVIFNKDTKIGIGTTSPQEKLDVVGYVKGQSGLCIGSDCRTNWPTVSTSCITKRGDPFTRDQVIWCSPNYPHMFSCNAVDDQAPVPFENLSASCPNDGQCDMSGLRTDLGPDDILLEKVVKIVMGKEIYGCLAYDNSHSHKRYRLDLMCCKAD